MSNQQLTKVVDTLEDFGLVVRNVDDANHRQIFVQASQKGLDLIASLKAEIDRKLSFALRHKEENEIDNLYQARAYLANFFGTNE